MNVKGESPAMETWWNMSFPSNMMEKIYLLAVFNVKKDKIVKQLLIPQCNKTFSYD